MANFVTSLNITLKHEGGYADLVGDTGGETIFGISKNNHPNSLIWKEIDNYKQMLSPFDKSKYSQLTKLASNNYNIMKEVENIYKEQYWYKVRGDFIINQDNANVLFDMAVNAGVKGAVKIAQKLVGVATDGICGKITQNAINTYGIAFCNQYIDKRIKFYESLNRPQFIKAWIKRADSFRN